MQADATPPAKPVPINDNIQATVVPRPVVTGDDDHSKEFYHAKSIKSAQDTAVAGPTMNADEDPAFKKSQREQGVGA